MVLPVNPNVDRSVCAEFQVLNELCDLVHQAGLADSMDECSNVRGSVDVLVSTTPCLSCVCAAMQYTLLFPNVALSFGCVQPWHTGGVDGAMIEPAWTGLDSEEGPLRPGAWSGGRLVLPNEAHASAVAEEPVEWLTSAEVAALKNACHLELGPVQTWADVRSALLQFMPEELAEVFRRHKVSVQPETLPERVARIVGLIRSSIQGDSSSSQGARTEAVGPGRSLRGPRSVTRRQDCSQGPTVRWRTVMP